MARSQRPEATPRTDVATGRSARSQRPVQRRDVSNGFERARVRRVSRQAPQSAAENITALASCQPRWRKGMKRGRWTRRHVASSVENDGTRDLQLGRSLCCEGASSHHLCAAFCIASFSVRRSRASHRRERIQARCYGFFSMRIASITPCLLVPSAAKGSDGSRLFCPFRRACIGACIGILLRSQLPALQIILKNRIDLHRDRTAKSTTSRRRAWSLAVSKP